MTQEEKLQKEIARIVSCEEELNYFENKGDLIDFVARHFYEMGKNADETIRKELIFFLKEEIPQCSIKEHADKLKEFVSYLEKQKDTMEKQKSKMTVEEFQSKLKEAKENKYVRAQLLWELMHNGIITAVDYQYLTDDKRKPWTIEEYRIAYQKGFEMSEQLKQKEQNCKEYADFTIYRPLKDVNGNYECIPYSFYGSLSAFSEDKDLIDFLRTCFCTKEECEKWIKQKEQKPEYPLTPDECMKPAEWNEEDKEMWMDIKSHMIHGSFIPFDKIEWIENRLKSLRPQPKPSWSEEDEKIMQTMIKEGDLKPSEIAWLKSLRSQPKQEWSEEDEAYRNFILESLEDQIRFCKKNAEGAYYAKQIRAAQNWLKSRCPSCKSSNQDELMRLKYAGTSTKLD